MKTKKLEMTQQVSLKLIPLAAPEAQALAAKLGLSLSVDPGSMNQRDMMSFLNPQEEDYVYIPVRALTATSVQGDSINFGHEGGKALKDAVGKFNDLPLLKDHYFSVDNWIGRTQDAFWDEATQGAPPGVTLMMKVDSKADPKVARGLISGMLDSVSVTIQFDFVKSHPNMSDSDFYYKLGEVVDGKTVQALVTEVKRCYELSVVWQGADVYAKQVQEDGSIHTPGLSHKTKQPHPKEDLIMKSLAKKLGLTGDSITEEQLMTALDDALSAAATEAATKVTELEAQVTSLKEAAATHATSIAATLAAKDTEITTLKSEVTNKTTELEALKPQAEVGKAFLEEQRAEAARLYAIVADGKPDTHMTELMAKSSLEQAKGFIATFAPQAEQIAPLKCTTCGSASLSRKASKEENLSGAKPSYLQKAQQAHLKSTVENMH